MALFTGLVTWHHGASCGMAPAPVPDPPRPPLGHLTQPHPQTHHPHHPIPPWGPSLTLEFTAGVQRRAETENCLGPPTLSGPPLGRGLYWPALGRRPRQEEGGGGGGGGRPQDSRTRPPDTWTHGQPASSSFLRWRTFSYETQTSWQPWRGNIPKLLAKQVLEKLFF